MFCASSLLSYGAQTVLFTAFPPPLSGDESKGHLSHRTWLRNPSPNCAVGWTGGHNQPRGGDGRGGDSTVSQGWSPPREGSGVPAEPDQAGEEPGRCCTPSAPWGLRVPLIFFWQQQ